MSDINDHDVDALELGSNAPELAEAEAAAHAASLGRQSATRKKLDRANRRSKFLRGLEGNVQQPDADGNPVSATVASDGDS